MEIDVKSDQYRNIVFERLLVRGTGKPLVEMLPPTRREWLRQMFIKQMVDITVSEKHTPPWKPLTVFEHLQGIIVDHLNEYQKLAQKKPEISEFAKQMAGFLYSVKRFLDAAHVVHLSKTPLRNLYEHEHTPHRYVETIKLPFDKVFIEFSEPLLVDAISTFGVKKDYLVGFMCEDINGVIFLHLIWDDLAFSSLQVEPALLPFFLHGYCGLPEHPERPKEYNQCLREMLAKQMPEITSVRFCPGTVQKEARHLLPCLHNEWRAKIVNLFINIITLLNAKNLEIEEVKLPNKRIRKAAKEGRKLPTTYRRVILDWFTPYRSTHSSATGTGRSVTRPYFRRGHFREYKPGKFTWVRAHICRSDLQEKEQPSRKIYRA